MENDIVRMLFLRRQRQKKRWKIKTISGAPPLSFKAKAGALKDYKIYGNTVDGESVGDLETTGEHAGEYKVPVTVSNGADTQTIPIYLPEQIKKVGDETEYIDYGEQKQHRVRKNLLLNTAASQTIDGVTFTVNSDRSVTCNGTANNVVLYEIYSFPRFSGECILSGCPMTGSQNTYRLQYTNLRNLSYKDYGTGVNIYQFDEIQYPKSKITIRIEKGYTCNNLTFYPMIRKADIEDDTYEPYITNTELDVTLPALPVLPGTNTLTVGTEVQPSGVEITGRIKKGE